MKLSGLDLGGIAKVLVTGDEQIPIRLAGWATSVCATVS